MRKLLFTLSLLLVTAPAFAGIPTLKENMNELGGLFKVIKANVADRSQNTANAKNAARMNVIFLEAGKQVPDSLTNLPPQLREKALVEYKAMIAKMAADSLKLRDAFTANDNRTAADLVNGMNLGKREGHDKFDK